MNLTVLRTSHERARGVIGREPTSFDDVFLFTDTYPGDGFHMRGVAGSLDFVWLDKEFTVVGVTKAVVPETGTATALPGTSYAVEVAAGGADHYAVEKGRPWVALANHVLNPDRDGV